MHDDIRRFYLEGEVDYNYLSHSKHTLEDTLESNMRLEGYVPVLDLDPQLTQDFNAENNRFNIKLSMYGVYVGEDQCKVAGLMYGKRVMKYIQNPKSKAS